MSSIVVGIDLGTSNTCVACYRNGHVKILENEEGGRVTPSYIFVTKRDKICVGSYAKQMADMKPEYGIYAIKRLMGRTFDDPCLQKSLNYLTFDVTNVKNEPIVSIKRQEDEFTANPVQLSTVILKTIKKGAEAKIGESVDKAVITVPAYFNASQREATLSAAKQAGFTVLKLLNEPTAAALSYYLESNEEENYSLVYGLGGGTFDVSVLKKSGNNIDIIGVDGDAQLGGCDFDNLIVDYVCDYLKNRYKYDPKLKRRDLRRLQNQCEEAKKILSFQEDTDICLEVFGKDCTSVEINLTRDQFERMAAKLFQTTLDIVDNCLKNCKIAKGDIKEVILSGGSTRIPKIQTMLSEYFGGKQLTKVVNPDECVAEGAAIQAAMFSTNETQKIEIFKITDVTPLSLGVRSIHNIMTVIIERNTPIPVSKTIESITVYNNQQSAPYDIYEGERKNTKKNRYLGTVTITDLTPAPPGQCEILITMTIDESGILNVKAKERLRDNVKDVAIVYTRGHRSDSEVKNALKDAEDNKLEDETFIKLANLKWYIIEYCEIVKYNLENKGLTVLHKDLYYLCQVTERLAQDMDEGNSNKLEKLKDRIINECDPVVNKYNFELMPVYNI